MIEKQPHGYENSSNLDSSRTVLSMRDQLPKSLQGTCQDIRNVISSLALVDGALLCSSQDGPQIDLFGQVLAHASHSAQQVKDLRKKMNATSGPCSLISSASAALSMSLGNRLQARLGTAGSIEYRQTWNLKATPAGRQYWAHTASAHRTSDKDCIGWPSPNCNTNDQPSHTKRGQETLLGCAKLVGSESYTTANVTKAVTAQNAESTTLTATVSDQLKTELNTRNSMASSMAGWPTASSRDWKDSPGMATTGVNPDGSIRTRLDQLPRVAQQVAGLTSNSSTAETEKPAAFQLNPRFSRWLMGFPPEWCDCAVMAMQSFPKSQRSSSKLLTQ